jgi:uncharacterized protein YndB with AHSA1/START domain
MSRTITPAPVRKSLSVNATPERAFEVFTARFASWWPPSHHIGGGTMKACFIEPKVGGRWYETAEDGSECDWGDVLVWSPPSRLVLAWRIGADWAYHADLLTEVDVRFIADGERTRIEFEHRGLERMGEKAGETRVALDGDGGWTGILKLYADAVG